MRVRILRLFTGVLLVAMAAVTPGAAEAKHLTDWTQAEPVPNVNDPAAADGCPIESPDGRSLYIASTRGPGEPRAQTLSEPRNPLAA